MDRSPYMRKRHTEHKKIVTNTDIERRLQQVYVYRGIYA